MQGLRAEHEVDVGRAFDDRRAFLAGDAAADADHHRAVAALELAPAAELTEYLFLRFFADRAGIDQNYVGFFGDRGHHHAFLSAEYFGHLGRVVLVHLAAVGLDEEFAWRRLIRLGGYGRSDRGVGLWGEGVGHYDLRGRGGDSGPDRAKGRLF